jgi:heme exporter protein D
LENFLAMGGYAAYVWPCYGVTLFALIAIGVSGRAALRRELEAARRRTLASENKTEGVSV